MNAQCSSMLQPRSTKIPQNNDPSSGSSQHRKLAQLATSAHHKLTISKSSGHPAHRCYETVFGAFTKNNIDPVPGTSSKLIQSSPSDPPFSFAKCVTVAVSSPLDTPLHPGLGGQPETGAGGRVALQAVESFTKVPKKKKFYTNGPTNGQNVQNVSNDIQFCQFRRSISLSHTDDACFP